MSVLQLDTLTKKLNADPYLQAYVASWGDTLDDDSVLENLQSWNAPSRAARN
jgi:hypothetical protein